MQIEKETTIFNINTSLGGGHFRRIEVGQIPPLKHHSPHLARSRDLESDRLEDVEAAVVLAQLRETETGLYLST